MRTEDRGGRKARSAAPPAADSRGGREASAGRKPGRSASRGCGPPRPSLQVRSWPRKLRAGKRSPELAQGGPRAGCRRGSPQPTALRGRPPALEEGGRFVAATPPHGQTRPLARGTSPGPASPARAGCRVPRTTVKSRTGAAHAAVLHAGRSPALTGPRRQKPGLRTEAPRKGNHAEPGCVGSHRQTRAENQRRGEREGGREEREESACGQAGRAGPSAASPVRGLQAPDRAKAAPGSAPRRPRPLPAARETAPT